jgi:hypothetical protein
MNQCQKCRASFPLTATRCPQCGWQFEVIVDDTVSAALAPGASLGARWAVTTRASMRRYCLMLAWVAGLSLNLLFLYYLWIAAEYGRDPQRAAWHLVVLSWIMASGYFLLTMLLMYHLSWGSSLDVRIGSQHWHDVWPIVGLVIGLAMSALYAVPLLSRRRMRAEVDLTMLS